MRVFCVRTNPRVLQSFFRGSKSKPVRSGSEFEQLAVAGNLFEIEVLHLRSDTNRESGGVESFDPGRARPARAQVLPAGGSVISNGRHHSKARNGNAAALHA